MAKLTHFQHETMLIKCNNKNKLQYIVQTIEYTDFFHEVFKKKEKMQYILASFHIN